MNQRTYIIAEGGVNHNGSPELAAELVRAAAEAGADAIKFQTFRADRIAVATAPKANYQLATTDQAESQQEMLARLELDRAAHQSLMDCCRRHGVAFLSSPFDLESVDLLAALGQTVWKIPSGELTNRPSLERIGALGGTVILSTGMADLGEIEDALAVLAAAGTPAEQTTLLHCSSLYPTPMSEVNLRAMRTLATAFPACDVGYSDHTLGWEVPVAAVALGAVMIEKHLTLDKNLPGPDHRASLDPPEFARMVQAIRNLEAALGDGIKRPAPAERESRAIARKSLVAARPIRRGEPFTAENLTCKRPGTGISPMRLPEILGRHASRDFAPDERIEP
ncbi:MAG: N-acetylneuraminate synthase [Lentisphaeria bacterium]|jgi:N,N'-diacetyllegionaminate synthase|nr:N-acetylneuraminate synthase [Lentisphaeria bacterium]